MSKKDPNSLNAYHNRGQEDATEGKYEPPNDFLGGLLNQKYEDEQKSAYREGWKHTKSQSKK